jgi:hypothetical protein
MDTYIVKVPVTGKAEIVTFNAADSYSQLRDAVGGYIEAAVIPTIFTKENYTIDCYVDEEGLLKQLPLNERLTAFARPVYNLPFVGNAVFAAHDLEGETVGLSKADAESVIRIFA